MVYSDYSAVPSPVEETIPLGTNTEDNEHKKTCSIPQHKVINSEHKETCSTVQCKLINA